MSLPPLHIGFGWSSSVPKTTNTVINAHRYGQDPKMLYGFSYTWNLKMEAIHEECSLLKDFSLLPKVPNVICLCLNDTTSHMND